MEKSKIKIKYLYHSGFTVQTKNNLLIFDYYKGSVHLIGENVFVFSSHTHADHFNPVIFRWQNERQDIKYILSSDIITEHRNENVQFISAYEEIQVGPIKIKAYNSTDLGVSFLVYSDGISIFHAGDLNWWYWWDESPEEINKAEKCFKEEIARLKGESIDIAFFPVDPRLEHNYYLGGEFFLKEINPKVFIPMHFGNNYEITKNFADKMQSCQSKVIVIEHRGQEIIL